MADNAEQKQDQGQKQQGNVFTGTGMFVVGIIKGFNEYVKPDTRRVYYSMFLVAADCAELKVNLPGPPDPSKYKVGCKVRVPLSFQENKYGVSFTERSESPA